MLKTQQVIHGGAATAPADPSRPGYTFAGWDKPFTNVTSDLDVNAVYQVIGTLGDVDGNGTLSVVDALFALRYAMGLMGLTPSQAARADYDGSGAVDSSDALLILRECLMMLI